MKRQLSLLTYSCLFAAPVFSGAMADATSTTSPATYFSIGGGYYVSQYQANYTSYTSGVLNQQASFDNTNNNSYGQLAIGANSHISGLEFAHQLVVSKLAKSFVLSTGSSTYQFKQNADFGYDLMPKIKIINNLNAYGILGAHYGFFNYSHTSISASSPLFNINKNQFGFNLGVGLNYRINPAFAVGLKYQHLQYNSVNVEATNNTYTSIEVEHLTPSYDLVGLEIRYYFS